MRLLKKKRFAKYSRSQRKSKILQDYLDVLPSSSIIKKLGDGRYSVTCPVHDDNDPSVAISQGNTQVVYKCFAGCDQSELTSFFNEKFGGRS